MLLTLVAGGTVAFAAWRLIPRPDLADPPGGPPWQQSLEDAEAALVRQLAAHADTHGGRYPDDTTALIPQLLEAVPDPAWLKRGWEWRAGWYAALGLTWATTLLWAVAAVWRGGRRVVGRLAVVATGVAYVLIACLWWMATTPKASYRYLDWLRVLPGLEEPAPRPVPFLWATGGHPIEARCGAIWLRDSRKPQSPPEASALDLARVEADARRAEPDVAAWLAEARNGDVNALLVLALRRESAAADLFAEAGRDGLFRRVGLWGSRLLRDPRVGSAALRALNAEDAETRAYAATLVRHVRPDGATTALVPLLDAEEPQVRAGAWGSLGCDGDPAALARFRDALAAEEPPAPRETLWGALARMGTPEALAILMAETERPHPDHLTRNKRLLRRFGQAGAAAVPMLAPFLDSRSPEEREAVRDALAATGCVEAFDPLLKAAAIGFWAPMAELARRNPTVRQRLFDHAMARLAESDDDANLRYVASALGSCGLEAAVEPLLKLWHRGGQVGYDAAGSLAQLRAPAALLPLVDMLEIGNRPVRALAARLLVELGDPRALSALRRAAERERPGEGAIPVVRSASQRLEAAQSRKGRWQPQ